MMKKVSCFILSVFLAFSITACGSKSAKQADEMSAPAAAPSMDSASTNSETATEDALLSPAAPALPLEPGGTKVILRAQLDIQTLQFDEFLKQIDALISQKKGFLESCHISGKDYFMDANSGFSPRNASLVARLPAGEFDDFLAQVGTLGNITQSDSSRENISLQYADTESRKAALQIEYDRLLQILAKAENLEAVVALESRLSEVRYELDTLSSTLRSFDNQVDYATFTLQIEEVAKITETKATTLSQRISSGFSSTLFQMKITGENLLVFLLSNSPLLLLLALMIFLFCFFAKRHKRRMAAKQDLKSPKLPQPPHEAN